jgi:hypothetical protein
MPTHAEYAVKSYNISNFVKTSKKYPKSKVLKNRFGSCKWVQKQPREIFIFDLALKKKCLVQAAPCEPVRD